MALVNIEFSGASQAGAMALVNIEFSGGQPVRKRLTLVNIEFFEARPSPERLALVNIEFFEGRKFGGMALIKNETLAIAAALFDFPGTEAVRGEASTCCYPHSRLGADRNPQALLGPGGSGASPQGLEAMEPDPAADCVFPV
jgi:hypothetical protein